MVDIFLDRSVVLVSLEGGSRVGPGVIPGLLDDPSREFRSFLGLFVGYDIYIVYIRRPYKASKANSNGLK